MTYTIFHTELPDGTWMATCDLFPAWKHKTAEQDKAGAETSLKRHSTRHTRFQHMGWDGTT